MNPDVQFDVVELAKSVVSTDRFCGALFFAADSTCCLRFIIRDHLFPRTNPLGLRCPDHRRHRRGTKVMTTTHEAPKKRQLPTVYTLLFIIIALMAALTWCRWRANSNYVTAKTQQPVARRPWPTTAVMSDCCRYLAVTLEFSQPQGVFGVLKAPIQGFHKAADVALFVLIIGGFLAVTMQKAGAGMPGSGP